MQTAIAFGTSGFHRAGVASSRNRTVFHNLCLLFSVKWKQQLPLRAAILIMDRIIGELCQSIRIRALPFLSDRNVSSDVGVLQRFEDLDRSIGGIAGSLFGSHTPTKGHAPEQVKYRLIIHHFAWHDQYPQD